jgi:hypothetical protein
MNDKVKPTPPIMINAETAWMPNRRTAGRPIQSSMKDTTKMRSIETTIHTLPDASPFGNTGFDGWVIANTLAARMRLITTLPMTANPPVWGVGMACNVRSLGCASIERNDFGEQRRFVSHQADTKAMIPGRKTVMIDISNATLLLDVSQSRSGLKRFCCLFGKLYDSFLH